MASDKGTQSRNGFADDQRAHLPGALVGIDRFCVGDEPPNVILEEDAIVAARAPCSRHLDLTRLVLASEMRREPRQ